MHIKAQEECSYITYYFNPLCGNKDRRKLLLLQQSAIVCDVIKSCQPSNPINFAESSISNETKVCVYVFSTVYYNQVRSLTVSMYLILNFGA